MEKGQLVENLQGTNAGEVVSVLSDNFVMVSWNGESTPSVAHVDNVVKIKAKESNDQLPFDAPAEMPSNMSIIQTKKGVKIQEKKVVKTASDSELDALVDIILKSETKNG